MIQIRPGYIACKRHHDGLIEATVVDEQLRGAVVGLGGAAIQPHQIKCTAVDGDAGFRLHLDGSGHVPVVRGAFRCAGICQHRAVRKHSGCALADTDGGSPQVAVRRRNRYLHRAALQRKGATGFHLDKNVFPQGRKRTFQFS